MKIFDEKGEYVSDIEFDSDGVPHLQNEIIPASVTKVAKSDEELLFENMSKQLSKFVVDLCDLRMVVKTEIIKKLPKAIRGILEVLDEFIKDPAIVEDPK